MKVNLENATLLMRATDKLPVEVVRLFDSWMPKTDTLHVLLDNGDSYSIVTQAEGTHAYSFFFIFKVGASWLVSVDVDRKHAEAVFVAMQRRAR